MFAVEALASKVKKGNTPDAAAFADLQILANLGADSAAIAQAEEETLTLLHLDLLDHLNSSLNEQKKSKRERGFDDLLLDVYDALTDNPQADSLAQAVAQNWRIALIDEFQDTDPLQYEIFRKIFIKQKQTFILSRRPETSDLQLSRCRHLRLSASRSRRATQLHAGNQLPQPCQAD